ncbi:hypothetical protein JYT83_01565 [bacterium AH-315-F18]|nr:hypothetical protein [bacterium AH-315-F18]
MTSKPTRIIGIAACVLAGVGFVWAQADGRWLSVSALKRWYRADDVGPLSGVNVGAELAPDVQNGDRVLWAASTQWSGKRVVTALVRHLQTQGYRPADRAHVARAIRSRLYFVSERPGVTMVAARTEKGEVVCAAVVEQGDTRRVLIGGGERQDARPMEPDLTLLHELLPADFLKKNGVSSPADTPK